MTLHFANEDSDISFLDNGTQIKEYQKVHKFGREWNASQHLGNKPILETYNPDDDGFLSIICEELGVEYVR